MQIEKKSHPAFQARQRPRLPVQGTFHIEHEGDDKQEGEESRRPVREVGVVPEVTGALGVQEGEEQRTKSVIEWERGCDWLSFCLFSTICDSTLAVSSGKGRTLPVAISALFP